MPDFILGRLKFKFQGEWDISYDYIKDDIVRVGGRSYVCVVNHTSGTGEFGDENPSYWELMVDGVRWRSGWLSGAYYQINDMVNYSGNAYICTQAHMAGATWGDNSDKFDNFTG